MGVAGLDLAMKCRTGAISSHSAIYVADIRPSAEAAHIGNQISTASSSASTGVSAASAVAGVSPAEIGTEFST